MNDTAENNTKRLKISIILIPTNVVIFLLDDGEYNNSI
jgi:hypothetical protein